MEKNPLHRPNSPLTNRNGISNGRVTSPSSSIRQPMLLKPSSRTGEQNKLFHSILGQIAKQATHLGSKWTIDDWKRLHLYNWHRERGIRPSQLVQALEGDGLVQLGLQSSKLTKEEAIEFTEYLMYWCAKNGVEIDQR